MSKKLIVYYSMDGNTRKIARLLQERLGGDLEELDTVIPYEGTDDEIVKQCEQEVQRAYMPELKPLKHDPSAYDEILLGSPTWWYTMASPILSFTKMVDWKGKTVTLFQTSCGWPGKGLKDMEKACKGADFRPSMHIQFSTQQFGVLVTKQSEIDQWVEALK